MRFAVSLFVIALGAILTFGIRSNPSGVDIHVIGLILILTGSGGLAIGRWLYTTRRQTDVIYRPDGQTVIEPNAPPHDLFGAPEYVPPQTVRVEPALGGVDGGNGWRGGHSAAYHPPEYYGPAPGR